MGLEVQLGKKGLTIEFIEALRKSFKSHEIVKISVLKSYSRDKEQIAKDIERICNELGCKCKLLGYTLILKRQKKHKEIKFPVCLKK
jgi:RNA-binding protein YhbY